jgi:mannose-6-phosphate isomerase-like protein (cupin superfamily)
MAETIRDGEAILRGGEREIGLLVASKEVSVIRARYPAGRQVAGPHVHHDHTDAFYVLEGELVFVIGHEQRTVTVTAGGLVAVPPGVAHSFRTAGERPARWLTIHAHDGGFAAFMRGLRDGAQIAWDSSPVPADGGLPARAVVIALGAPAVDQAKALSRSRARDERGSGTPCRQAPREPHRGRRAS